MAEDLTISHGEPQWDVKYNNLVNTVETMGGVVNSLNWSDGSQEGIVVTDNRVTLNKESHYSYLNIGGKRLVFLHVVLDVNQDIMSNVNASMLFSIPAEIAPTISLRGTASSEAIWVNIAGTNFYVWQNIGVTKISAGQLFFTAIYPR